MLDTNKALKQANRLNRINITEGAQGCRGKDQDRWEPINAQSLETLKQAKDLAPNTRYWHWLTVSRITQALNKNTKWIILIEGVRWGF